MAQVIMDSVDIHDAHEVLRDYYDLEVPLDQVEQILETDLNTRAEIAKFGAYDTETRTTICELFLGALGVTRQWPTYGDSAEYKKQFYAEIADLAQSRGWTKA